MPLSPVTQAARNRVVAQMKRVPAAIKRRLNPDHT